MHPTTPKLAHATGRACVIAAGALLLLACGASKSGSTAASPSATPGPGHPAQPMASTEDPDRPGASTGAPMAPGPDDCSREIALDCPAGMVDGCGVAHPDGGDKRLTAYHICVSETQAAAAAEAERCEREIARQCGVNLIDACLARPPASDVHVCVQRR